MFTCSTAGVKWAWFYSVCLFFLSSCANRFVDVRKEGIPLFIAMPKNAGNFDNFGTDLYEAVHKRFSLVGYNVIDRCSSGYSLTLSIQRWEPLHKLVSPDVILFHEQLVLEILCQVYNFAHEVVLEKKFTFSFLLSKPQNPILNTDFGQFELERVFERVARDIELFIRPLFVKR